MRVSFTNEIKNKLSEKKPECDFCSVAELAGIVRFSGAARGIQINITTENEKVARCVKRLLKDSFGIDVSYEYRASAKYYRFDLDNACADMVYTELMLGGGDVKELMPFDCCKRAFLTGAFLGGGSINDPQRSYHLEFDTKIKEYGDAVLQVLRDMDIPAKMTERKGRYVVYLKGFEAITTALGLIGADSAALQFYSVSVEKELRNDVNRKVNCENANLDKLAQAASKQIHAITKIQKSVGLGALSDTLREMAELRLEYPEESLKELGERLNPPIGKSGVNHRLSRIIEFADKL